MSLAAANPPRERKIDLPLLGLIVTLLVGAGLRFYGLNWDGGHLFHPDERHILMVTMELGLPWPPDLPQLLSPDSPLSPHSFAYGSFVFYLLKIAAQLVSWVTGWIEPLIHFNPAGSIEDLRLVGRVLSALFDLGTVLLTFLVGRRVFGKWAGLLAAVFVSFSVINIQLAHFYASDTLLTFFVLAVVLLSLRLIKKGDLRTSLILGVALGLALATKVSVAPIVIAIIGAHCCRLFLATTDNGEIASWTRLRWPNPSELGQTALSLLVSALATALLFAIAEPYALIDSATFLQHISEQSNMVRGMADFPYTRQYIDRTPYWYFVSNLSVWGVGLPLGIAMWVGLALSIWRSAVRPRPAELVLLAWVIPYFLITGGFQVKFLRYLLPITPLLAIFAAGLIITIVNALVRPRLTQARDIVDELRQSVKQRGPRAWRRSLAILVIVIVLAPTLFYAGAYMNIYSEPHPGVSASEWIYDNAPDGSVIAVEHWEEVLPVSLINSGQKDSVSGHDYQLHFLNLYEPDNEAKLNHLVTELSQSHYIVFYSNRLYGTIPRLPARYPLSTEYYHLLFSGQLGFELQATSYSYPNLLGVAFVDDTFADPGLPVPTPLRDFRPAPISLNLGRADESLTVYDHPKVLIFGKQHDLSEAELRQLLQPALETGNVAPAGGQSNSTDGDMALLTPDRWSEMIAGGSFDEMFDQGSPENQNPLLTWVVLLVVLGVIMLPSTLLVFRRLPDRGYGLVRSFSLLALGWLTWIIVSLGILPNTRTTIALAFGILLLANLALLLRHRRSLLDTIRDSGRVILISELVFWAAFALFLTIRAANPDLWHAARGGEKPMDLAYLMAVMKSSWFPPYDPWFAGGYLNYYYFGQIIVGSLIKLSGILPVVAYNLVIPLLFALTFSGAFSAALNLVALRSGLRKVGRPAIGAGLAAGVMAVILGNLGGALQFGQDLIDLSPFQFNGGFLGLDLLVGLVGGAFQALLGSGGLVIDSNWYWASTRVIEGTINEFPFFTFLYADLHAHLMALPLTVLVLGLAINWLCIGHWRPFAAKVASADTRDANSIGVVEGDANLSNASDTATDVASSDQLTEQKSAISRAELLALLGLSGLGAGALLATNTWDYPTYMVVLAASILVSWYMSQHRTWQGLALRVSVIIGIAVASYVLFWPFHANFQSFYFGVEPFADRSNLKDYLTIHGLLLFAIVSFLLINFAVRMGDNAGPRVTKVVFARWDRLPRLLGLLRRRVPGAHRDLLPSVLVLLGAMVFLLALAIDMPVVSLLLVVLAATTYLGLCRSDGSTVDTFILAIIALGAALGIICEVVAIKGDIGRMNTVFKFYLQVWMLWSVAAAFGLYTTIRYSRRLLGRGACQAWLTVLTLLVLASAVYPLVGTYARVNDRFDRGLGAGLDGSTYMQTAVYQEENGTLTLAHDLKAIEWIQGNIKGSPVILEGRAPLYRWGSRVSIYTGLPTVLGWDWHQKQQRAGYIRLVDERARDVEELYSGSSIARCEELLSKYKVSYIYIGELERAYYPMEGLAKFDTMTNSALEVVYDRDGVKIYRVL